ncbi:MAG: hypothetical protein M0Q22_02420 [Sulfuritalea sp.]|jgi:hypothetical protein|nr:hypothetical protein [Sulfuritalea sp.]
MAMRKWLAAVAMTLSSVGLYDLALAQVDTSPFFCLFEIPPDGEKRVWINLSTIQYIEMRQHDLRIYYGGGKLGSGHELRVPIVGKDDGYAFMKKMQTTAVSCGGAALSANRAAGNEASQRP